MVQRRESIHVFSSMRRRLPRWLLMLCMAVLAASGPSAQAATDDIYTVRVIIERVTALDDIDPLFGEADFYAFITIYTSTFRTPVEESDDDIQPGWSHSLELIPGTGDVPITLALWDEDGGLNGADDHVDIRAGNGRDLNLTVNVFSCAVSGDMHGACGGSLTSSGAQSDRARIQFRIEVDPPAQTYFLFLPYLTF